MVTMRMSMITYTTEKVVDCLDVLKKLSELHYDEVAPYDDIPLNVAWWRLLKLEGAGVLKFYAMKKGVELIGYAMFTVGPSIEYSESVQASLTNIFIHPDHRGYGGKFILWCDEQLKKCNVQVVYHHVKSKNDYGVLLKRLGYDIMNIEYSKRLDKQR